MMQADPEKKRWYQEQRVQRILDYVRDRRRRQGICPTPGRKTEFSGLMFGEFKNLLEVQLLHTPEFKDAWQELRGEDDGINEEIVEGVLAVIEKDRKRRLNNPGDRRDSKSS